MKIKANFGVPVGVVIVLICVLVYGWFANIYKLVTACDFSPDTSYKCEIIRAVGIPFAPMGIIAGYISIDP